MSPTSTSRRPPLHLLTFNRGSSSLKMGLFSVHEQRVERIGSGLMDFRRTPLHLQLSVQDETLDLPIQSADGGDDTSWMGAVMQHLSERLRMLDLLGVVHRVVHGGDHFTASTTVDDSSLAVMAQLVPFAPLHQPKSLQVIHALRKWRPGLHQVACFDTAFHASQSELVRRFAIPRRFFDAGIKRYGFHGLSYQFIARQLTLREPRLAAGRVVVAHLGSGSSLCGLHAGVSCDTSMGFSTLDGIPMATRCGAIDAGVLLHWLGPQGLSVGDVTQLLYEKSGLLGVSGLSADSRDLLSSDKPEAREALDLYAFRIAGEVARLANTLGGLDGLVFTGGVGEHQGAIRAAVCQRLQWLGLRLDHQANDQNQTRISDPLSPVMALVIPTDEEQVMAEDGLSVLRDPMARVRRS